MNDKPYIRLEENENLFVCLSYLLYRSVLLKIQHDTLSQERVDWLVGLWGPSVVHSVYIVVALWPSCNACCAW